MKGQYRRVRDDDSDDDDDDDDKGTSIFLT